MNYIFRFVLILIVFAFVVYVIKAIARLSFNLRGTIKDVQTLRQQVNNRSVGSSDMLRCANCGAFVSPREAIRITQGKSLQSFCSRECMNAHIRVKTA